jgi:glucose 1-dehydrogenase
MPSDVKTEVHKDDLRVDLRGVTAIVTGAATGIGSAIAARFAASGANVIVDYPNRDEYSHAKDVLAAIQRDGGSGALVEADVTNEQGANRLVAAAVEQFGGLDVLVNNAGVEKSDNVVDLPLAVWERIVRTNLTGAFLCARAAARAMIERKQGGRIINISSVHEDLPMPGNAAYCASKGGMRMLMRTLALELAPHGITVNDIAPGAIATRINRGVRQDPKEQKELLDEIPLHRAGDADEVAALAAYLASKAAAYITASTYVIDGGLLHYTKGL